MSNKRDSPCTVSACLPPSHTHSLPTHTQTCTLYGKLTWLDAVSLVMHVECWWGSLGAFFKKKKKKKEREREKKGEAVESFLCACKTERKERRGRERGRVGRKQTSPHYSSKSNPALTSWLERAHAPNHVSTQWNTSTRSHGALRDAWPPFHIT